MPRNLYEFHRRRVVVKFANFLERGFLWSRESQSESLIPRLQNRIKLMFCSFLGFSSKIVIFSGHSRPCFAKSSKIIPFGGKLVIVNGISFVRGCFVFQKMSDIYCACAAFVHSCVGAGARAA